MSEELPPAASSKDPEVTKVIYYVDEEETPYMSSIPVGCTEVTFGDFKNALFKNHPNISNFKFFFRSMDDDIGMVKEEITDENKKLPAVNGRVVSWLVTADGSAHSDSSAGKLNRTMIAAGTRLSVKGPVPVDHAQFGAAAAAFDQTGMTSDSESTVSGLPQFPRHGSKLDRRMVRPGFGSRLGGVRRPGDVDSTITSDSDTARFQSDDDRSRISSSTDITSVSRQFYHRQRKKRKRHRAPASRASSISSITESSMSLNIINVVLNMDTVNFLGISIVGQSNQRGDGGIFVANIMKGGAVALDGRIEPGDMILQVNDVSFEQLSNDDAVQVLRECVQKPGPIKLVVAKCWDPSPKGYFTIPRQEPVRPIDPGAWVEHTNAMRHNNNLAEFGDGRPGSITPTPGGFRPPSVSTMTSQNSGSMTSSVPESDRYAMDLQLDVRMPMQAIMKAMARPESGLDIRDRTWLKITIHNAFLGSDVVEWLHNHVSGLSERRDARKYAARMLKEGHIKHTVNKITFSEQCYYVFGDLCGNLAALRLGAEDLGLGGPLILPIGAKQPHHDDGSQSDHDTVGPLPPPPAMTPTPWSSAGGSTSDPPSYTTAMMRTGVIQQQGGGLLVGTQVVSAAGIMMPPPTAPSMASGYASMPFQYGQDAGSYPNLVTATTGPAPAQKDALSATSGDSGGSSGSERKRGKKPTAPVPVLPPMIPPKPAIGSLPLPPGAVVSTNTRGVEEVPRDLAGSRQSFRMAMGNPCEFFVDVM